MRLGMNIKGSLSAPQKGDPFQPMVVHANVGVCFRQPRLGRRACFLVFSNLRKYVCSLV